jgi:hypothetical protein
MTAQFSRSAVRFARSRTITGRVTHKRHDLGADGTLGWRIAVDPLTIS